MRNAVSFLKAVLIAAALAVGSFGVCRVFGGEYRSLPCGSGGVSLTNAQQNSVWSPSAVLMRFGGCPTGVVSVVRESRGCTFLLSAATTNSADMGWYPDGGVPFRPGDVLRVYSGGSTGVVQFCVKAGD